MQPNPRILILILLLLLLAGCAPSVVEKTMPPEVDPREAQALSLAAAGDFLPAAALLLQVAEEKTRPDRERLLLAAAEYYLLGGDIDSAGELINRVDTTGLAELGTLRRLLLAELSLGRNRPEETLALLQEPLPENASLELRQRYHRDLAKAYRLTGNLLESGRQLGELDLLLLDPAVRLENQIDIIQNYAVLTETALALLQPDPPGTQGGWMELTRIFKQYGSDPDGIPPLLQEWRQRFPEHPALPQLVDRYFERLQAQYLRPERLAVLLPQEGRFANAANALRNGLLASYYQQDSALRPQLTFYDSSNPQDVWPLYQQAVTSGADMVIGPLDKQAVAQFARAGELEIPVLALNQVTPEVAPPADLYQFALAPEDEARQVAERAWTDGFSSAIVLVPEGNWGERILNAFRDRWEQLGGALAESQQYDPKQHDFTQPITSLLDVDQSKARHSELQRLLGKPLEFEPRRRQDAGFIFLAAKTRQARSIRPQLQFHHAAGLPVYSTSHAFSGRQKATQDQDLEGLKFPDIPWLLISEDDSPLSRTRLSAVLPESRGSYQRLYAMGIDSYLLLPHLVRLKNNPGEMLEGRTGNLYLDAGNLVRRQLVWAQIENGLPRVIGYSPHLEPAAQAATGFPSRRQPAAAGTAPYPAVPEADTENTTPKPSNENQPKQP